MLAIAHRLSPPGATLATPHAFICDGGQVFWIKSKAQNGLSSELVSGRIGHILGITSQVSVIRVPPSALLEDGTTQHLEGINFGSEHVPGCENARDLERLRPDFDTTLLDRESWVRSSLFQTFLDVSDTQVMIDVTSGRVWSIDHGHALSEAYLSPPPDNVNIKQRAAGVVGEHPNLQQHAEVVLEMVREIEELDDEILLHAVCGMPDDERWRASDEIRFNLWTVLKNRRDALRKEATEWIR